MDWMSSAATRNELWQRFVVRGLRVGPFVTGFAVVMALGGTSAFAQDDATGTPLEDVTREMKVAATQLARKTTNKQTQDPQAEAVAKLDRLIAALEKERQQLSGNQVNARPTMPAQQSNIRTGPGGMGDLHGAKEEGNKWGNLPAHERDRILQSMTEGFPPQYQAILEAYYRRLATEKKADLEERRSPTKPASGTNAPPANDAKPAKSGESAAKDADSAPASSATTPRDK